MDKLKSFMESETHLGETSELDLYLEAKRSSFDDDLYVLSWWRIEGKKYPTLSKVAKDLLAIPVSTVTSESVFSTSGRLVSPHRSRLHLNILEALMCSQSWLLGSNCTLEDYGTDDDSLLPHELEA
nr:zinc finger BED domain-containing protein DAYSLEEPER-like [Ipomoea batatas]